jgi:hypothetical protein
MGCPQDQKINENRRIYAARERFEGIGKDCKRREFAGAEISNLWRIGVEFSTGEHGEGCQKVRSKVFFPKGGRPTKRRSLPIAVGKDFGLSHSGRHQMVEGSLLSDISIRPWRVIKQRCWNVARFED